MADTSIFELTGRVAVATGSTKGIGRGVATGLARAGASVVVSSRRQEHCEQVAAEIEAETGGRAIGVACHVGDWEGIPKWVETIEQRIGGIDVLVNNAGINPARLGVAEMDREYWRKVFSVNLEGPLRLCQVLAPRMRQRGGGSIVNVATMAAYSGGASICAYAASKAALVNLTKSMAQEWAGWGVRVNVVSPGPFMSEMVEGGERGAPGFKTLIADGTFMKRIADPREMVGAVLYLASDASSFVTGDDLSVSGGMQK